MSSISFSDAMTTKTRLRKGKGLERITKSLGSKVPIQIAEGMKRPEKPLQAAKLASTEKFKEQSPSDQEEVF